MTFVSPLPHLRLPRFFEAFPVGRFLELLDRDDDLVVDLVFDTPLLAVVADDLLLFLELFAAALLVLVPPFL
ncbi:MAG: hypothetical protein DMF69_14920, partial [Acidobacteria bacterium]